MAAKLVRSRSRRDRYAEFGERRGPADRPGVPLMRRQASKLSMALRPTATMSGLGQIFPCPAVFATRWVGGLDVIGTVMSWIPWAVRGGAASDCGLVGKSGSWDRQISEEMREIYRLLGIPGDPMKPIGTWV
jgi:hypothetical protein